MGFKNQAKKAAATAGIIATIAGSGSATPPSTQLGKWQSHRNRQQTSQATQTKRNIPTTGQKK